MCTVQPKAKAKPKLTPPSPGWSRMLLGAHQAPLGAAGVPLLLSPIAIFQVFTFLQDCAWAFMPSLKIALPSPACWPSSPAAAKIQPL